MLFDHIEEKEAVMRAAMIEVNGSRFYAMLAEETYDDDAKRILGKLARDEKRHLKTIEAKYFPEAGFPVDEITEEETAIEEYVAKSADMDIFTKRMDVEKLTGLFDSPKKALLIALNAERYSVDYFENMGRRCRAEDARKICRELAEEERAHVKHIEDMLARL
ncbi:MAG: ferritin family protein [Deltaproteobacteria bacterium]|nr:ferritin family protein [Deltaproteobacteria bacterium]